MKITAICENTTRNKEIVAEHGLSLFAQIQGKNFLFDFGQSDALLKNANALKIDLGKVDFGILSHAHYDHGNGLKCFFEANKSAPVFVNKNALVNCYNAQNKYIGLCKGLLDNDRVVFTDDRFEICDGLTLFSCNDRRSPFEILHNGLTVKKGEDLVPDNFLHEQVLLAEENGERVLISGCSHKGFLNLLSWFAPHYFVGGLHLNKLDLTSSADKALLDEIALTVKEHGTIVYTCHCTGITQFEYLKNLAPDNFFYLSAGMGFAVAKQ